MPPFISVVEKKITNDPKQMKVLLEAALLLRKAINSCTKWVFSVIGHYEFSVSSEVFVCTRPTVKCFTVMQRALSRQFLKSLALESEQRTATGPQISANERVNMEPSSPLLLLLTPKIGRTSISWQAGHAG